MSPKEQEELNARNYVEAAVKTEHRNARETKRLKVRFSDRMNMRLIHAVLGLSSELSEVQEAVDADKIDTTNLMEEVGDLYWYMAILADEFSSAEVVFVNNDSSPIRTARPSDARALLQQNVNYMVRNAGSLADLVKKTVMYGKDLDVSMLLTYLRGLDYNINQALRIYGMTAQAARESNLNKLSARYEKGFTEKAALNRDLKTERSVLEKSTQS
jgi:hypothetical protein